MKLNSAQIEQTLSQIEAQVIPDDHPMVPKLNEFVRRPYVLPQQRRIECCRAGRDGRAGGTMVNLANWTDAHLTSLAPHEPEPTEIIVMLETEY
jgi:hypothetical protein